MGESGEVIHPGLGNSAVYGIVAQSKVADQHGGVAERLVEGIRVVKSAVECLELKAAGGAFDQSPRGIKEAVQEVWQEPKSAHGANKSEKGGYHHCSISLAFWTR